MSKQVKTLAKEYDFNYIEDYFEYIFESKINGQIRQARQLFAQMNKDGQKQFIEYCLHSKNALESLELLADIF